MKADRFSTVRKARDDRYRKVWGRYAYRDANLILRNLGLDRALRVFDWRQSKPLRMRGE